MAGDEHHELPVEEETWLRSRLHELSESRRLLDESRAHYAELFDSVPVACCRLDPRGRVLEGNLSLVALTPGRSRLEGLALGELVHPDDRPELDAHLSRCRELRRRDSCEVRLLVGTAGSAWFKVTSAPLPDAQVPSSGTCTALTELSGSSAAAPLLPVVAHELKNALTVMNLNVEGLRRDARLALDAAAARYTRRIWYALRTMRRLVAELQNGGVWAVDASERCAAVDLVREGLEAAAELAADRDIELFAGGDLAGLQLPCDRQRVLQVLENLLGNAIKFAPRGGHVALHVRRVEGLALFTVTDDGPGVAPEDLGRLFERGWQSDSGRAHGGHGLGLFIAKRLVEAHGGRLWAEPVAGHAGAAFHFTLPLAEAPQSSVSAQTKAP